MQHLHSNKDKAEALAAVHSMSVLHRRSQLCTVDFLMTSGSDLALVADEDVIQEGGAHDITCHNASHTSCGFHPQRCDSAHGDDDVSHPFFSHSCQHFCGVVGARTDPTPSRQDTSVESCLRGQNQKWVDVRSCEWHDTSIPFDVM